MSARSEAAAAVDAGPSRWAPRLVRAGDASPGQNRDRQHRSRRSTPSEPRSSSSPKPIPAAASSPGLSARSSSGSPWPGRCSSSGTPRRCRSSLGFGMFNDTEARSLHLGFALFLGFLAFRRSSARRATSVAWYDWLLALVGRVRRAPISSCSTTQLATRPGQPTCMRHRRRRRSASCCCSRPRAARWACR